MSLIRNTLAAIGAVTVGVYAVRGFNKYLRQPLADLATEAMDAENQRRETKTFGKENVRAATPAEEAATGGVGGTEHPTAGDRTDAEAAVAAAAGQPSQTS